jgi:hypothetical protein
MVLLAGATMLAAVGVAGRHTPPTAEAATPTAAAPDVAGTVDLRLSASPSDARMFLDDGPLAGNPFHGELPRDGAAHWLRVEAPGFVTRRQKITLDRDRGFEIALVAAPPALAAEAASSQVAPGAHGGSVITPGKHRKLDSANPYAL